MKIKIICPPDAPTPPPIQFKDLKDGDIFQWKYRSSSVWQPLLFLMLNKNGSTWGQHLPMAINLSTLEQNPTKHPGAWFEEKDTNVIYRVYDVMTLHAP
jgi:hypothetical protein